MTTGCPCIVLDFFLGGPVSLGEIALGNSTFRNTAVSLPAAGVGAIHGVDMISEAPFCPWPNTGGVAVGLEATSDKFGGTAA